MSDCASWNPVVRPGVPYEPEPYVIPSDDELEAMTPHRFNKERTKAKAWWYYFMRRKWRKALRMLRGDPGREGKIDELQKVYRDGRAYIFGPEPRGCNTDLTKKPWKTHISYVRSWQASRPDWYLPEWDA